MSTPDGVGAWAATLRTDAVETHVLSHLSPHDTEVVVSALWKVVDAEEQSVPG